MTVTAHRALGARLLLLASAMLLTVGAAAQQPATAPAIHAKAAKRLVIRNAMVIDHVPTLMREVKDMVAKARAERRAQTTAGQ